MATATQQVKVCQSTKTVSHEKRGVEVKRLQKADAPIFHLEKLGLRSGLWDLAEQWHHSLYGTEKDR